MNRMSHIKCRLWVCFVIVLFLTPCILTSLAFGAGKSLRLSTIFPPSSYATDIIKKFADEVRERTSGEIKITVHPPGSLAKPMEQFDLIKRGAIDLGFSAGLMHARKIPEGMFEFSLPFSFFGKMGTTQAADQFYEFFYTWRDGIVFKKLVEVYDKHGITLVGGGPGGGYGFLTNFPVKTLDDFKGKKLRSFGTLSTIVQNIGGSPVTIANPEQYMALQRGTIDGTIYTYYSLEAYKLREVVTHIVYPPVITTPVISVYGNKKVLDSLTESQRKIIHDTFLENIKFYSKKAIDLENEYIATAKAGGVKEVALPAADAEKLKEIARDTWPAVVKRSKVSQELTELLKIYLAEKEGA